eukprot:jgi/Orpsp1_1/1174426/evm.model.c7180000050037.1
MLIIFYKALDNCSTVITNYVDKSTFTGRTSCELASIIKYCKIDSLLYGVDNPTSGSCATPLNGAFVINGDTPVDLTQNLTDSESGVRIYACDGETCNKVTGVIKANDGYFEISSDPNTDPTAFEGTTGTPGECIIGKVNINDNTLCLGTNIVLNLGSKGYYLMDNGGKANFPVDGYEASKSFVILSDTGVFAYDIGFSAPTEVFKKQTDNAILTKKQNFCAAGSIVNTLYSCEDGLCEGQGGRNNLE